MYNYFIEQLELLTDRIIFVEEYTNNKKYFELLIIEMYKKNELDTINLLEEINSLFELQDKENKKQTMTNTYFLDNLIKTSKVKDLYLDCAKTLIVKRKIESLKENN